MHRHRSISILTRCLVVVLLAGSAHAATDYERLTFRFSKPAHLTVSGGGKRLVLRFDQPAVKAASQIQAQLGSRVTSITQSGDGKEVTLTLDKPYRTRHFVSGNMAGVDILTGAPLAPVTTAPTPAKKEKPAAKKPAPAKPAPKAKEPGDLEKPITPPAPKAEPKPQPKPEAVKAEPEAAPAPAPEPVKPLSKKATEPAMHAMDQAISHAAPSLLTTKAAPAPAKSEAKLIHIPQQPAPVLTTKEPAPVAVPPAPAPVAAPASTIPEKKPAVAAPKPPAAPPAPEPPKAEAPARPGSFLVTTQTTNDGTWINFPWEDRVASAVFERNNEIWIIFSKLRNANVSLLGTVLPKGVTEAVQFASGHDTILRLTTDGSIHAIARQPKGSFHWQVLLSQRRQWASLDTPLAVESDDGKTAHLLLSLFDAGEPLRFYDPHMGDLLLVFPTYEEGRGVVNAREFPAITAPATQQGVVIVSQRDDLVAERSRVGIRLGGEGGLPLSQNLPTLSSNALPIAGASTASNVMMPYDQWYVLPGSYTAEHARRMRNLVAAPPADQPDALLSLVQLTLGQGYTVEALGYLNLIQSKYPDYYRSHSLALLHAACNVLILHPQEAADDLAAPELAGNNEAQIWREAAGLYLPPADTNTGAATSPTPTGTVPAAPPVKTPEQEAEEKSIESNAGLTIENTTPPIPTIFSSAAEFDFLAFDKPYIRFYPPYIRQHLAKIAAEYYLQTAQEEKALRVFDTLNRDNILKPLELYAEFAIGKIAEKKDQVKQALDIFDHLAKQDKDRYLKARGRYEALMLRYSKKLITPKQAENGLEQVHMSWHGGNFERTLLINLAQIYKDNKQYDETLRTWKYLLTAFPGDHDTLAIAGDMGTLFQKLFLEGEADAMPPLKALAAFYEFRELTPIGDKGDEIIQRLGDRLAAVDLLDRAAQLLDHQIKFRLSGEARARVGARLALVYLLNQQPEKALIVLQTTNYGASPAPLQTQRQQLTAQALSRMGKNEGALSMLYSDNTPEGALLRLDILWAMGDWPNIINQAEDILAARPNLTDTLKPRETVVLIKLALAYSFERDMTQLGYLRDYYMGLVPEGPYKEIFSFITSDTAPLDTDDFTLVAKQISHTESFLDLFHSKIAAGKLSDTVK